MEQLQKLKEWLLEQKAFNEQHRFKSSGLFNRSASEAIAEEQGIARNDTLDDVLNKVNTMIIAQEWLDKPQPKPAPYRFEVRNLDEIFVYAHGNKFHLYDINFDKNDALTVLEFHRDSDRAKLLCIKSDSNLKGFLEWTCTVG